MCAVHNIAVVGTSLISLFLGMLRRYYVSDFEISPIAPIITGLTLLSYFTRAEFLL